MASNKVANDLLVSSGGVKDFFAGRSIFVTGATGFMGKVLLEKLLRTCDQIERIYVLVRPKPDVDVGQRFRSILNVKIFDKLLKDSPGVTSKLTPVMGDVTLPSMGLCEADENMVVKNVSVVFHLAATIRFDEPLKKALRINLGGTNRVIDLCHKMPALKALVYVSTAYSHCQRQEIHEVFYPSYASPLKFMDVIENMEDELIASITPLLLSGRPNSYSLSKALSEQLLVEEAGDLPVVVIRPSIVGPCWKKPIPGWTEGYYGPNGMLVAYSKGLLRCMIYDPECSADYVPVDAANNLAIAAAWYTAIHKPKNPMIYNCTVNKENKMNFAQNREQAILLQQEQPIRPIWHPGIQMFRSLFVKMQKKILHISTVMSFFSTREWRFSNTNMWALWEALSPQCKQEFHFDIREIHWPSYSRDGHSGVKRFVLQEDLAGMKDDRRHAMRLRFIHHACQMAIVVLLCLGLTFIFSMF